MRISLKYCEEERARYSGEFRKYSSQPVDWRTESLKIKDLKKLIESFDDEDEVGIEENEQIYDCYAYDDEWCRQEGHPCLVFVKE